MMDRRNKHKLTEAPRSLLQAFLRRGNIDSDSSYSVFVLLSSITLPCKHSSLSDSPCGLNERYTERKKDRKKERKKEKE